MQQVAGSACERAPSWAVLLPSPSLRRPVSASVNLGQRFSAWVCSNAGRRSLPVGHARSVSERRVRGGSWAAGGRGSVGTSQQEADRGSCAGVPPPASRPVAPGSLLPCPLSMSRPMPTLPPSPCQPSRAAGTDPFTALHSSAPHCPESQITGRKRGQLCMLHAD